MRTRRLYVGNLAWSVRWQDLKVSYGRTSVSPHNPNPNLKSNNTRNLTLTLTLNPDLNFLIPASQSASQDHFKAGLPAAAGFRVDVIMENGAAHRSKASTALH